MYWHRLLYETWMLNVLLLGWSSVLFIVLVNRTSYFLIAIRDIIHKFPFWSFVLYSNLCWMIYTMCYFNSRCHWYLVYTVNILEFLSCRILLGNSWSSRVRFIPTSLEPLCDKYYLSGVSFNPTGSSRARILLLLTASMFVYKLIIRFAEILMVTVTLVKQVFDLGARLRVRLENPIAYTSKERIAALTYWDDCFDGEPIIRRIIVGLSSFTMPWATNSMLSKQYCIDLVWTLSSILVLILVLLVP